MKKNAIEEQIEAMKSVFETTSKSKESVIQFLKDAGIYEHLKPAASSKKKSIKSNLKK